MPPHLLANFKIQKYYQNEPKFNGVYSRNNLSKIKDRVYVINLEDCKSIGTNWIVLYINGNNIIYFDSLGFEYISKLKRIIGNKNIISSIYRIQTYDSVMWECFCIGFIDFMLKAESLLDYTNLFSPNYYEKNYKIILKWFK